MDDSQSASLPGMTEALDSHEPEDEGLCVSTEELSQSLGDVCQNVHERCGRMEVRLPDGGRVVLLSRVELDALEQAIIMLAAADCDMCQRVLSWAARRAPVGGDLPSGRVLRDGRHLKH